MLLRAFIGSIEMLNERFYDIDLLKHLADKYDIDKILRKTSSSKYRDVFLNNENNKLSYIVSMRNDINSKCIVFFADDQDGKIKNKEIDTFISIIGRYEKNVDISTIIISENKMSNIDVYKFNEMKDVFNSQHFLYSEIMYNPLKSVWVPKILEIFDPDETIEYLKEYTVCSKNDIPKNSVSCVIAKYLGLKPGCLIIYERNNFVNTVIDKEEYMRITYKSAKEKVKTAIVPKTKIYASK
jgi:DNA-directed RNA polymerase subunit H (RpoH/RPB5)